MPKYRRVRAFGIGLAIAALVAAFSVDYTVVRGDTLSQIADKKNVSLNRLIKANHISNPDLIFPGQVLVIPGKNGGPPRTYVVVSGDTLYKIAARFGVSAYTIAKINALANPDLIFPGQELAIRAGSGGNGGGGGSGGGGGGGGGEVNGGGGNNARYHIVKSGESVESIAARYSGVTAADIIRANGIVNGAIYTGTRLFLEGPGYVARSGGSTTYTVKSGDRLVDIAARHGTTVSKLAGVNDISDINVIVAGQVLKIPGKGKWVCPLADTSFFNDWGFPRDGGERYHEGNDLFASFRSKVRAPVSGKVVFKVGSIGGNQFNLSGSDGVLYIGSHMDSFNGKSRRVKAGDVLGYVGSTGNAVGSSPHLHFGMYWAGTIVNPYPSLLENGCK